MRCSWQRIFWLARRASFICAVFFCVTSTPITLMAQSASPSDGVSTFAADDPEMNAAIAAARSSMDVFTATFGRNPEALPLVKVAVPYTEGVEHMWMLLKGVDAKGVSGVLSNDGVSVSFRAGERYEATHDQVSDWMVLYPPYDSGPIFGAYTTRVALKRDPSSVPPGVATRLRPLHGQ